MPADRDIQVFQDASSSADSSTASREIVLGTITGIDPQGQPLVNFPDNPVGAPLIAISTLGVTSQHIGRQVALLFSKGNLQSPVIMGIIHSPLQDILACYEVGAPNNVEASESAKRTQDVVVDGSRIVIEGKEEIVLKCGDASITLMKSGKIVIRGKYLVNRSSGVNRILGGSVQIN